MSQNLLSWMRGRIATPRGRSRKRIRAVRPRFGMEPLEERSLLSVTLGAHFPGLNFAQTGVGTPPDTIAAAGPSQVVEMVNTNIAFYDKTGNLLAPQQNLTQFFSGVMTGNALSDPFVVYDEQAGRFVVGVLDLSATVFGTVSSDRLLIAVSNDSNPLDGFAEKHSINVTESAIAHSGNVWGDYPRVGWNHDEYVVTLNMFGTGFSQSYDHVSIITIGKTDAIDSNNSTFTVTHTNRPGSSNFTMAPATMHDAPPGGPMYFVEVGTVSGSQQNIEVVSATGLLGPSPNFSEKLVGVDPYTSPPAASQKGSSQQITTNDERILNAEWRRFADGTERLVATHTIGVPGDSQAHARWYEFNTTDFANLASTPAQQGTIGVGSGSSSYFPGIAIAPDGDLGMSFIQSSSNEYMSVYVTGQAAADPRGVMQAPVLAQAGQAPLSVSFDSSPYRAGDYSGITVDPANGSFWAANEYATNDTSAANWGTAVANFTLTTPVPDTQPPTVTVVAPNGGESWQAGTTQTISWTASDDVGVSSVVLSYSTSGAGGPFATIATVPNTGSFSWTVPNSPTTNAFVQVVASDAAGNSGSDLSNAAFTITSPPPVTKVTVTGINPSSMTAGSSISVTITGTSFQTGASVTFVNGQNPAPTASNMTVSADGTTITATVSVSKRARNSSWNVQVTNPNGTTGVSSSKIFTVTGGKIGFGPPLQMIPGPSPSAQPPLTGESPIALAPSSIQPANQDAGTGTNAAPPEVVVVLPPSNEPGAPAQDGTTGRKKSLTSLF